MLTIAAHDWNLQSPKHLVYQLLRQRGITNWRLDNLSACRQGHQGLSRSQTQSCPRRAATVCRIVSKTSQLDVNMAYTRPSRGTNPGRPFHRLQLGSTERLLWTAPTARRLYDCNHLDRSDMGSPAHLRTDASRGPPDLASGSGGPSTTNHQAHDVLLVIRRLHHGGHHVPCYTPHTPWSISVAMLQLVGTRTHGDGLRSEHSTPKGREHQTLPTSPPPLRQT